VVTLQGAQQVAVRNNVNHVQQGIGVSLLFFDTVQK
jgi:peptide/nickel transport system substrate-binding protein